MLRTLVLRTLILSSCCLALFACPNAIDGQGDDDTLDGEGDNLAPLVSITAPNDGAQYFNTDVFELLAEISDDLDDPQNLEVLISSDLVNDPLDTEAPDDGGLVDYQHDPNNAPLPHGEHTLTVTATDTDGLSGSDSIVVTIIDERAIDNDGDGYCEGVDIDGDGTPDCDGTNIPGDCDDSDPNVNPGQTELCDGQDNDCNGQDDFGGFDGSETDNDGDGLSECDGDCNDNDPLIFPGATEICDGLDNDCVGGIPSTEIDNDGDGFFECNGDCDNNNSDIFPGATEICDGLDNDCAGGVPASEIDNDGDGQSECNGDCDDTDPNNFSGAAELCDGQDNNCNGQDDFAGFNGSETDADGDGHFPIGSCMGPADDCDDTNSAVHGGNTIGDPYDNLDNDCDGNVDNGPCMEEECETNNRSITASFLPFDTAVHASLCGELNTAADWWRLGTYTTGETIDIFVEIDNPLARFHIEIYDSSTFQSTTLPQFGSHGHSHLVDHNATYYVWVYPNENPVPGTRYTLTHGIPPALVTEVCPL